MFDPRALLGASPDSDLSGLPPILLQALFGGAAPPQSGGGADVPQVRESGGGIQTEGPEDSPESEIFRAIVERSPLLDAEGNQIADFSFLPKEIAEAIRTILMQAVQAEAAPPSPDSPPDQPPKP